MKKRSEKQASLESMRVRFTGCRNIFITGFEKMTVAQDYDLRKTIRGAGGSYEVIKNTIAEKAAEGTPAADVTKNLVGMTSMVWTDGDVVNLAKALTKYAKDNPQFKFKAGYVEGNVIDLKSINDLATMPSKEEIYAKLLFLIQAPAQRLVTAMNGVGRNLAVVVDQGVKENKFSG
jgi:large subunit ribosomal protein L10